MDFSSSERSVSSTADSCKRAKNAPHEFRRSGSAAARTIISVTASRWARSEIFPRTPSGTIHESVRMTLAGQSLERKSRRIKRPNTVASMRFKKRRSMRSPRPARTSSRRRVSLRCSKLVLMVATNTRSRINITCANGSGAYTNSGQPSVAESARAKPRNKRAYVSAYVMPPHNQQR